MPWTNEDPLQFTFRRAQRLASLNISELLYECGMYIEHCPNFDLWDDGSDFAAAPNGTCDREETQPFRLQKQGAAL